MVRGRIRLLVAVLAALAIGCGREPAPPPHPAPAGPTPEQQAAFAVIDGVFRDCGFPIVGLPTRDLDVEEDELSMVPWIVASLGNDTLPDVMAGLRRCAELLLAATESYGRLSVKLYITDPATVAALPEPTDTATPLSRLDDYARLLELRAAPHYFLKALTIHSTGDRLDYTWPQDDRALAEETIQRRMTDWLADPAAVLGPSPYQRNRLVPGRADRLRYYRMLCGVPLDQRQKCDGPVPGIVAATVDIHTLEVTDFRMLPGLPHGYSLNRLDDPLEPDLTG